MSFKYHTEITYTFIKSYIEKEKKEKAKVNNLANMWRQGNPATTPTIVQSKPHDTGQNQYGYASRLDAYSTQNQPFFNSKVVFVNRP